jgi:hypothetical protein
MCADARNTNAGEGTEAHVPDFSAVGFAATSASSEDQLAQAHAAVPELLALALSVCVSASYDPGTNKICFTVPIYGQFCITPPVSIPVGGQLKACAQTCGQFIPTGLKVTIYLNGTVIWSGKVVGRC